MPDYNYEELYNLTTKIYKVGLNWSAWEEVLEHFASYVENGKASIIIRHNEKFEIDIDNLYLIRTWNLESESMDLYRKEAYAYDVWADLEYNKTADNLCVFSDHLPKTKLLESRFYKKWLKPINITDGVAVQLFEAKNIKILLKVFHNDNTEAVLDLCRDLKKVTPHLCRAATMHMKLLGIDSDSEYKNQKIQLIKKYGFTPREVEVATSSVYLSTNKKIAESLGIDESTVKKHIKAILTKMNLQQKDEISNKLICFINPKLELIHPIDVKPLIE